MSDLSTEDIIEIIHKADIAGFSGACGEAAVAINRVLFGNKGVLLAAVNEFMHSVRGKFHGHVVVEDPDSGWFFDARGVLDKDSFEAWGMLDVSDPDLDLPDDEAANEIRILVLSEDEVLEIFGCGRLFRQVQQLSQARDEVLSEGRKKKLTKKRIYRNKNRRQFKGQIHRTRDSLDQLSPLFKERRKKKRAKDESFSNISALLSDVVRFLRQHR